ncbi:uncharacterized protein MCAP_0864-like [Centruroides vittatus]|uniref:uncharacterized protein MCAP_0864-like n=1 Tax=Centruroides vittatus TaxID=120091 RepID=UPI003510A190
MSFRLGFVFIYLLSLFNSSYLISDSFFSEASLPRTDPNPFFASRWRNLFSTEESLINPILRNSQRHNLFLPRFNYPVLFPEEFNDTKTVSNLFLDNKSLKESINLFDLLQKNVRDDIVAKTINLTKIDVEDDILTKDVEFNPNTEETEVKSVTYEKRNKKNEESVSKNETTALEEGIETENEQTAIRNNDKVDIKAIKNEKKIEIIDTTTEKYEVADTEKEEINHKSDDETEKKEKVHKNVEGLQERQLISKSESFDQDGSTDKGKNFNDDDKKENMKHVLETEKTSSVVKVDDAEASLKDIKMEEVTTVKTDLGNVVGNSDDGDTESKKETKDDGENRKINLKTEIEDGEVNLEKNRKQIMSVENNEERSESKKVKSSREETNRKIEKTNEESVQENELNEIKIEDTIQNGQFPKSIIEGNDNDTNKNGSQYEKGTEMNNIEDLNELKDRNRKVQETLRETLPDELSNSDLDVLQDNSTNFICLTDSSKCLSKSTSILLTTGILIGIIVGLVTIVGITTGLSVYIFHRWKLRKKPRDKSRTSKMDRVVSSTARRPVKNRSTKRKLNLREVMEENDSPVNTLEAITVHNYSQVGRYSYNL